jgi:hypothetical protein
MTAITGCGSIFASDSDFPVKDESKFETSKRINRANQPLIYYNSANGQPGMGSYAVFKRFTTRGKSL